MILWGFLKRQWPKQKVTGNQDAIANLILAELEGEKAWPLALKKTKDKQWEGMADRVHNGICSDDTDEIDKLLP